MRMTFTARGLALLAIAFLGCNSTGDAAPPRVSTQRKELTDKPPASLGSECVSAQQPRLIVAPSEEAPESAVQFEGKELKCGETYTLVVSGPDGTKTSESLVADAQGSAQSHYVISSPPEEHDARLYDSRGEEVAQLNHTSNFLYGHLTWRTVGPRTAEFSLDNVFRRVFPGSGPDGLAVTGDTFQDIYGYAGLCFGEDSCTGPLTYRVTSYDVAQGWVRAQAITSSQLQEMPGTGVTVVETEPNDTLGTANSMQLGDDYSSNIGFPYDSDYVRFTLPQRTRIQIGTVLQTLGDSYLYLYDSQGIALAYDDDSGPGLASLIQSTLDAGTYYIRAAAFSSHTGQQRVQLRQMGILPSGPITHTYASDGPFTANLSGCCRASSLSYSDSNFLLRTRVGFGSANSSPVSSLPPSVEAPRRTPDFSFQIPATDADGDALTFRLAAGYESYLWELPPGLTVSSTGLVSWDTTRAGSREVWALQVIIEERREGVLIGSSPVDFLLLLTGDLGSPPTCVPPPQARYTVLPGQTLEFTVGTQDSDDWDTVTLSAWGLPWYAIPRPALPLQGPGGISSTISYTPSSWDVGYAFSPVFTVTDSTGQSAQCTVSIEVLTPGNWPPVANAGSDRYVGEGSTVTLDGTGSGDREGLLTYQWTVVSGTGPEVTLSSATSATPSFSARNQGVYTFRLTVTDSEGVTASDTVDVYVYNVAPVVNATGGQLDEGQEFTSSGSFTDPGADSWTATVDYGDGTGVQPLALNDDGTFTLSHRYLDNANSWWGRIYSVQIVVTDDSGAEGTSYVAVDVRNVAPVILTHPTRLVGDEAQPLLVPITFTDPGEDSWWAWVDYGDGYSESVWIPSREFTFTHTYYDPGTYSLTIMLSDDDGDSQTITLPVEIHNVAPTVSLQGGSVNEGSSFYGYGRFEDPGSGWWQPPTIMVDYGDGTAAQSVEPGPWWGDYNRFWLSHEYADSGTYLITVTVTDVHGGVGTATATVVVNNVAPWVYLGEPSWYYAEGSEVVLHGYTNDPGTQDTLTALVDYGDGTGAQPLEINNGSLRLSHAYGDEGKYTVTLTVMDDDGGVGVATRQVSVYNVTPTVSATGGTLNEGSTFTSSGTFTDPGADTWTARVNYGDGTGWQPLALNGKSFLLEHAYANSGTYVVYIYVRDSDGAEGSTYVYATVRNVLPVVSATGGTVNEGSAFTSSVSFTDPGSESSWTASIDYGDGSSGSLSVNSRSFTLSHVYTDNGTYTVTIRVRDDGGVGTTTTQVVVHNVAPTVTATGGTLNEGSWFTTNASYSDPSSRDTAVAQVDYGDGSPVETLTSWYWERRFTLSHRYAEDGTYQVRISVIDDDGGVGTTTVSVEVRNVAPAVTYVASCTPYEGSPCNTSGQFSDPGADSWTITVNFGDGSATREFSVGAGSSKSYAASHVYDDSGLYTVVVTFTDDDGASSTFTYQVKVFNVAPTVTASNDSPRYWGVPVNLLGTATDPSQADTQAGFTALWTLGDGMTASGLTTAHAYAAPGTYGAQLRVTDKDGGTHTIPARTTVTIQKRPGVVTCQDTTAMFGFPVDLSAQFVDGLEGGLPGGRSLSFRLGDSTGLGSATTDALGQASVRSPGELMPGSYPITVSFAENSHYTAAEATCTLTVTQVAQGGITGGGLRFPNQSRGGLNVMREEGGPCQGELQFQNEGTSFHAHELTALGISADKSQGWFAGVDRDGRSFMAYVEDNGDPGTADVFKLWIDGALQTGDGDGTISGGNIQIH